MSEPRTRSFTLPEGFTPRVRGAAPIEPVTKTGPHGTQELPVVRDEKPEGKKKRDNREHTGEPRPTLGWGFWPRVLLIAVLAIVGVSFVALNGFDFSAFAAMFVIGFVAAVIFTIVYFIAKANKKDDDHSNPKQGPDKVEDHRDH